MLRLLRMLIEKRVIFRLRFTRLFERAKWNLRMLIVSRLERLECTGLRGAGHLGGGINRLNDLGLMDLGVRNVRVVHLRLMKRAGIQAFLNRLTWLNRLARLNRLIRLE